MKSIGKTLQTTEKYERWKESEIDFSMQIEKNANIYG
jgi:hypothetical protein